MILGKFTEEELDQPFCGLEDCFYCPTPNQIAEWTGEQTTTLIEALTNVSKVSIEDRPKIRGEK